MMELNNRTAIVTGGTSGIGKAIARRFITEGASVAVIGHSDQNGLRAESELRELARSQGAGDCVYLHADVADRDQVRAAISAVIDRWHRIHILVNNAAIMKTGPMVDMEVEDWDRTMTVNMRGSFLFSKYAIPAMPADSAIVNISSVHAVATDAQSAAYSASKGALEAFTRALALECFDQRIRVNALRLGAIDSPMLWQNPAVKSGKEKIHPLEMGKPEEVAEAALFLASGRASFISGAVLNVDGGRLPILGSHAS
jgi:NAD(P)-dependent dehydrogenase (short-subunit alcohol dehydrogenase family)